MGKLPWQCTTTGLDNSIELRMEKIRQAVTEIWVPQVWQPPARPPARTVTTIPLQPEGLRGKKVWQTDGQTDGQKDWTIHRAAWSQLKIMLHDNDFLIRFLTGWWVLIKNPWQSTRVFNHKTDWQSAIRSYAKHTLSNNMHLNIVTYASPDSKVHGANMGPIWGRQDPGGPHVGPMNFAIWDPSMRHQSLRDLKYGNLNKKGHLADNIIKLKEKFHISVEVSL